VTNLEIMAVIAPTEGSTALSLSQPDIWRDSCDGHASAISRDPCALPQAALHHQLSQLG